MAKYAQKGLRMHLLQSRISKLSVYCPSRALPHLRLRHSTLTLLYKLRLILQFFFRTLLMGFDICNRKII